MNIGEEWSAKCQGIVRCLKWSRKMQKHRIFTSAKEVIFSLALVWSLVHRITWKILNRISPNLGKRWHMGQGRNNWILMVIQIWIQVQVFLKKFLPLRLLVVLMVPHCGFGSSLKIQSSGPQIKQIKGCLGRALCCPSSSGSGVVVVQL